MPVFRPTSAEHDEGNIFTSGSGVEARQVEEMDRFYPVAPRWCARRLADAGVTPSASLRGRASRSWLSRVGRPVRLAALLVGGLGCLTVLGSLIVDERPTADDRSGSFVALPRMNQERSGAELSGVRAGGERALHQGARSADGHLDRVLRRRRLRVRRRPHPHRGLGTARSSRERASSPVPVLPEGVAPHESHPVPAPLPPPPPVAPEPPSRGRQPVPVPPGSLPEFM
jgi:hypothetical protein